MKRRQLVLSGAATAASALVAYPHLALAQSATASGFPKSGSTLKYIVPFPPGGLTDSMARTVAQKLTEAWKVSVVVENKAGNHTIGNWSILGHRQNDIFQKTLILV